MLWRVSDDACGVIGGISKIRAYDEPTLIVACVELFGVERDMVQALCGGVVYHSAMPQDLTAPSDTALPLGRLTVFCGPMFTGKTTALIDRLEGAQAKGDAVVVAVKPSLDNRYHATDLTTHDGRHLSAQTIDTPGQLIGIRADVIGLDEAHFFEHGLHETVMILLERGVHVLLAGLDRTSMNEPFGEMGRILIEADEVVKLSGVCAICGRSAAHTVRLFDSTESIVVGGPGMFENRCRAHLSVPQKGLDNE